MIKKILTSKLKIHNFFNDFIVKKAKYGFCTDIINTTNGKTSKALTPISTSNKSVHFTFAIPPYLDLNIDTDYKNIPFKKADGYAMDLKEFDSITEYMSTQFGSKSRGKIRSYLRRLENCFNISYKFYHGKIDKTEYEFLFKRLEELIVRRFDERGEKHQATDNWDYFKSVTFNQIIEKKASLFVIYDNDKPIDICLNYHYDNVMINYIRSYDIDYSKFRLGYIDIYKQLELCFENNYKIFDFCIGDLDYKKQWCNYVYQHGCYISFYKKSIINYTLGHIIGHAFKLKANLDSKKSNNLINEKQTKNSANPKTKKENNNITYNATLIEKLPTITDYTQIDIENVDYASLRKFYYDHLYLNFEMKNEATLYKSKTKADYYLFNGKKNFNISKQ